MSLIIQYRTGLPLPSPSTIVQNILQKYIPIAIATLIEPVWILINRLLCMLPPIEQLQDCNAQSKESINLAYSSLPPQLVIFKAIYAQHFVLAVVCVMAFLSNLLAVAFAGIFRHETVDIRHNTTLFSQLDLKVTSINGTDTDFMIADAGMDQYLVADSILTRGTPLPNWIYDLFFYQPFLGGDSTISGSKFEAITGAFGAESQCSSLELNRDIFLFRDSLMNSTNAASFDLI